MKDFDYGIELQPDNKELYNARGIVKSKSNDYHAGIEDFNKAMEIDSLYINPLINRGNAFFALKRFPEAIADYEKALKKEHGKVYLNRYMGLCYYYHGEKQKALTALEKVKDKLDPAPRKIYDELSNSGTYSGNQ
ncbi:MAG: tetratricopeptide repeat protein [Bacteroidetes bacterium]|nr:tetratricopeptide repeat protein [Bacteroidota bacterium]